MSQRSLLSRLQHTEPSSLGQAPMEIKAAVGVVWLLACAVLGHGLVVAPKAKALQQAQYRAERLTERTQNLQLELDQYRQDRRLYEQTQTLHREAQRSLGPLMDQHQWLAGARLAADRLGLELHALKPATFNSLATEAPAAADRVAMDWLVVDAELTALGLLYFDVEVDLSGEFDALLHWLESLQQAARVWPYRLHFKPAIQTRTQKATADIALVGKFRIMGFAGEQPAVPLPIDSGTFVLNDNRSQAQPVVWEMPDQDWWRALPLERWMLMGTGHIEGQAWLWLMDPTRHMRAFTTGDVIGPKAQEIVEIHSQAMLLRDADNQLRHWVW